MVTIFIGLIALTFLPRSILDPRTLVPGLKILNERDSQILHARLISDDATKSQKYRMKITTKQILAAFASWPFYPLLFFIIALIGPVSGLETYNNQIITSFGFSKVRGNALSSFGYWVQIPIIYLGGLIA